MLSLEMRGTAATARMIPSKMESLASFASEAPPQMSSILGRKEAELLALRQTALERLEAQVRQSVYLSSLSKLLLEDRNII